MAVRKSFQKRPIWKERFFTKIFICEKLFKSVSTSSILQLMLTLRTQGRNEKGRDYTFSEKQNKNTPQTKNNNHHNRKANNNKPSLDFTV